MLIHHWQRGIVGITKMIQVCRSFWRPEIYFVLWLMEPFFVRVHLIYQGTTTSIPHSEMEQWMSILFADDEILVEKLPRLDEIYWPVEAVNLFTRRQDIVENYEEKSEDDLLDLRNTARLIEKLTVQEIKGR